MTRMKGVGIGVYQDETGAFYARPWVQRRRTWRKLAATSLRSAVKEAHSQEWIVKVGKFDELSKLYIENDCPNKRLEPRHGEFVKDEKARIVHLDRFFGRYAFDEIKLPLLPSYKRWRSETIRRGSTGERAIDKELCTLSNVLNYGVMMAHIDQNFVAKGRPKYRRAADVVHCRDKAPSDADVIHRLAEYLFDNNRSEVLGWQLLFTKFTGCRTSEILRLKRNALPYKPGYIEGNYLFLRRSKGGVNPFSIIGPEFREMIEAFQRWHDRRHPTSHDYFPNYVGDLVDRRSLVRGLSRACAALKIPHVTPHGVRSFYVTKRRSDGISDVAIAGEIGDKTTILMETTYGSRPPNWFGGKNLHWIPEKGLPAWTRWLKLPVTQD